MAFEKFATNGLLQYNDIKKFFESVGHVPSQKEIDEAIEIVTKSKRRAEKYTFCYVFHTAIFLESFYHLAFFCAPFSTQQPFRILAKLF